MISLGLTAAEQALYELSLFTGYNLKVTVQILDLAHRYITDVSSQLVDGQVNNSRTDEVNSSASLTLLDPDFVSGFDTSSPSDGALYADRMIRIVYSVSSELLPKWVDCPIFCGPVIKVTRDDAIVSVECQGKEALGVDPTLFFTSKTYKKGEKVSSVLIDAAKKIGETKFDIDGSRKLASDKSIKIDTVPWTFLQSIAGSKNLRQLWYDGRGVLRLRDRPTKPVFVFTEPTLKSVPKLDYNAADIKNTAYVRGADPAGKTKQLTAKRYLPSSHPASPAALGRNGTKRYMVEIVDDDTLKTQKAVNTAADDLIDTLKTQLMGFDFDSFVFPHLEQGDVVALSTRDVSINLTLDQYAIPLLAEGAQSNGVIKKVSANATRIRRKK